MKQIIKCKQFYRDVDELSDIISSLEFEDTIYGKDILNFSYIPQGLEEFFESILNEKIEIQSNTGTFRKPSETIHFDPFYQHALWTCIVAVEDTTLNLHTHRDGAETFFDVRDKIEDFFIQESVKSENWRVNTTVSLKKNEFVFIRPWILKSLQQDKLVQVFLLNAKLEA